MIMENTTDGQSRRHGKLRMTDTPSETREPREASGGLMPRPIKDRNDSAKIAPGTVNVMLTMMMPIAFGIKWRRMMRHGLAPKVRAASTYSCSFREST